MNAGRRTGSPSGGRRKRFILAALSLMLLTTSCAAVSKLVPFGTDTRSLAGVWVDSTKATPTDTIAWKLDANGSDWTLEIRVVRDSTMRLTTEKKETRYGYWYLRGLLTDTAGRALCVRKRPRDGATCYGFEFSTVQAPQGGGPPRRRLVVLGYQGQQHKRPRILLERLP